MFDDRLKVSLTLDISGTTLSFSAGSVKHLELKMTTYGFDAEVHFFVSSEVAPDATFPAFTTTGLIKVTLSVANGRVLFSDDVSKALVVCGYGTYRRLREVTTADVDQSPIVGRHYVLGFSDAARVFWGQHRPLALYADTSMHQVIDLHTPAGMTVTYDFPDMETSEEDLCIGLGGEQNASFYDFVFWYVHEHHGVVELDPAKSAYRMGKTKAPRSDVASLVAATVDSVRLLLPEPLRYTTTVLNPFTEAGILQKQLTNSLATTGSRLGAFAYTPIATVFDARVQIETDRLAPPDHHLEVIFSACPDVFNGPLTILRFGKGFSTNIYPSGKTYRILETTLSCDIIDVGDGEARLTETTAPYHIAHSVRLEVSTDTTPQMYPFRRPTYPVFAEGRVLSASGQPEDRTFFATQDATTSLLWYRIHIPLWDAIIVAPFVPNDLPGHFFFPAYQRERVLVAFDFSSARIATYLEWAGRLPRDTQGDQIVLGLNDQNGTVLSHTYVNGQPVFKIARNLNGDSQTWTVDEGGISMVVKQGSGQGTPSPSSSPSQPSPSAGSASPAAGSPPPAAPPSSPTAPATPSASPRNPA
jgi:hypothetical protein